MAKKTIDCTDLIGTYDIKGANEVIEKLKGRINDYYVHLFNELMKKLEPHRNIFDLAQGRKCVDNFIRENPEILNMYTKESLYAMVK